MAKQKAFPPGEYLADELDARGWTQAELAKVLDRPFQHVNLIVNGKRRINAEIASELAAAMGTSAAMWLNLQAMWDAYTAPPISKKIAARAERLMKAVG